MKWFGFGGVDIYNNSLLRIEIIYNASIRQRYVFVNRVLKKK